MMGIVDLPFPRFKGLQHAKDYTLVEDLYVEQWIVPKETTVTLYTSQNFGMCALPVACQDKRGFIIPKRLFRW